MTIYCMRSPRRYAPRNDNLLYEIAASLLLAMTIYCMRLPRRYPPRNDNLLYEIAAPSGRARNDIVKIYIAFILDYFMAEK